MSMKTDDKNIILLDIYARVAEAEERLSLERIVDIFSTLKNLRTKYGI